MMHEPPRTLVAGVICLDMIPALPFVDSASFERAFAPGRIVDAGRLTLALGGAVPNTGLALHRLGVPVTLLGRVGDDALGAIVRQRLEAEATGLSTGIRVIEGLQTSYSVVISPPGMDRIILHAGGANDTFEAGDLDTVDLTGVRHFHFGYPPTMRSMYAEQGTALVELFARAKKHGLTTSLDMSLPDPGGPSGTAPWADILKRTLPHVDFFLPSLEEIVAMLEPGWLEDLPGCLSDERLMQLSRQCHAWGARVVCIKLGEHGLFLQVGQSPPVPHPDVAPWPKGIGRQPCFAVHTSGTLGAGDTTIAGFLAAYLRGCNADTAVENALAVGACCVEAPDALSGIQSWESTRTRIANGWARRPDCLPA